MRVLVVGAGAIGGYFGARLLQAGRDVTFLVRPGRAAALATHGLAVKSQRGDALIEKPATVLASDIKSPFDLIILSCKAYDLDNAIESVAPAVGPNSTILPLLNGMGHLDALVKRFGEKPVLGGQCIIAATLDDTGRIVHLNDSHGLTYGERDGQPSARMEQIAKLFEGVNFDAKASGMILQEMWEKWIFLASLASATSLMRASLGDILAAPNGRRFMLELLGETSLIAEKSGFAPREPVLATIRTNLTAEGSPLAASMARDIRAGNRIEADHVIGDLIRRGKLHLPETGLPLLDTVFIHLKAYERQREREAAR